MTDRVVNVRLDTETRAMLDTLVEESRSTRSDVIRELIHDARPSDAVWMTFQEDGYQLYGVRAWGTEIEALRHVAGEATSGITVNSIRVPLGSDLKEAVQARWDETRNR